MRSKHVFVNKIEHAQKPCVNSAKIYPWPGLAAVLLSFSLFHAVLTELIGHGRDSHWRQEGARSESD